MADPGFTIQNPVENALIEWRSSFKCVLIVQSYFYQNYLSKMVALMYKDLV